MGVWTGGLIGSNSSYHQVATKIKAMTPEGFYPQWILKAGEGGTWQATFDSNPLAPKSAAHLKQIQQVMASEGVDVQAYVNTRGRWLDDEMRHFKEVYNTLGFVIVHTEPGTSYFDPNVSQYDYVSRLWNTIPGESMELVSIPRFNSYLDLRLWANVGHYAAWETYGDIASDLEPDYALPRVDFGNGPAYQIPIVQQSMLNRMDTWRHWIKGFGFQVWYLDGSW